MYSYSPIHYRSLSTVDFIFTSVFMQYLPTYWIVNLYKIHQQNTFLQRPEVPEVKGTVPRDFRLQYFSWISFPQAPGYPISNSRYIFGVVDSRGKFATGIKNTSGAGGKIYRRCRWYRWCTLTCEIKITLMLFSGAYIRMIHEKKAETNNLVALSL